MSVSFGTRALCRWKGKSCPDSKGSSCCLGDGDILVMDGQCQDEFLHCMGPGLEQGRINVTFRWIRQHASSCPLRTGAAPANVCEGFFHCCYPGCGECFFPCILGDRWRLVHECTSLMCTGLGLRRCACRWTRPLGGGRWGIIFVTRGVHWFALKFASCLLGNGRDSVVKCRLC